MSDNKKFQNWKVASRSDWGTWLEPGQVLDPSKIQIGAILRIADAAEAMAKVHTDLIRDRDKYQRWYLSEQEENKKLKHQLAAMRGEVTKKNKAIYQLEQQINKAHTQTS